MGLVVSLVGACARAPPVDYADKLLLNPWHIFAPQRWYIVPPPLTRTSTLSKAGRGDGAVQRHQDSAEIRRRPCLDPQPFQPSTPSQPPRHFQTRPSPRPGQVASTCSLNTFDCRFYTSGSGGLTMPYSKLSSCPSSKHSGLLSLFLKRDTCSGPVHAYLPQLTRHHAETVSVHNRGFSHVMAKR